VNSSGAQAYYLGVGSGSFGLANFNFDLRRVDLPKKTFGTGGPHIFEVGSYTQANGSASVAVGDFRISALGAWRESWFGKDYSASVSARWDIMRSSRWSLAAIGDLTHSNSGNSAYVGLSLQLLGKRGALTTGLGYAHRPLIAGDQQSGLEAAMFASAAFSLAEQTQLQGSLGLERDPRRVTASGSLELRTRQFALVADALLTEGPIGRSEQFAMGGRSTIFASSEGVRFSRNGATESSIIVKVTGARDDDRFEILLNGQPRGWLRGDEEVVFVVPAYRVYTVRVRPDNTGVLSLDSDVREISLYPGNVAKLEWQSVQRTIVFGQLVDSSGTPLPRASIKTKSEIAATDDQGLFQIEASSGEKLSIRTVDGRDLAASLGALGTEDFLELGVVLAKPDEEGLK
jgi:hypothetical protein